MYMFKYIIYISYIIYIYPTLKWNSQTKHVSCTWNNYVYKKLYFISLNKHVIFKKISYHIYIHIYTPYICIHISCFLCIYRYIIGIYIANKHHSYIPQNTPCIKTHIFIYWKTICFTFICIESFIYIY